MSFGFKPKRGKLVSQDNPNLSIETTASGEEISRFRFTCPECQKPCLAIKRSNPAAKLVKVEGQTAAHHVQPDLSSPPPVTIIHDEPTCEVYKNTPIADFMKLEVQRHMSARKL